MIKTLFLGSNWEALSTFKTLFEDKRFDLIGLITQPDKPVGRKKEIIVSDIKKFASENGIPVFHTEGSRKKYKEALELFNPDLIVCKSFGEMIPSFFLESPKFSSINVHYSLLPKFRGAVPIQKAILEGEKTTGITYVKMVKELDAGPILRQIKEDILPNDTNITLRERLVKITGETIGDLLEEWVDGKIELKDQNDEDATYCQQSDISKENAYIDWTTTSPITIERMSRALLPWPVMWTFLENKRLKIYKCSFYSKEVDLEPGEYGFEGECFVVGTKDRNTPILLEEIQIEGKTVVSGKQFALGKNFRKI